MIRKETSRNPLSDDRIEIQDYNIIRALDDTVLIGNWFVFFKPTWLARSGLDRLMMTANIPVTTAPAAIAFRGKDTLSLPGAHVQPTPLPSSSLVSLTCDKTLYRAQRDTVRLLIAAPQSPGTDIKLALRLNGNAYADYTVTLDEYGLYLWSMPGLPEGEYEATVRWTEVAPDQTPNLVQCPNCGSTQSRWNGLCQECHQVLGHPPAFSKQYTSDICRFEIAEYRLAPLNVDLVEQVLTGNQLSYTLHITAFGQPLTSPVEVELQERGQRIGTRKQLTGDDKGYYRGTAELTGAGPYTLNVFAGERTASVALKGSEQERREALTISELGEVQVLSLLPLPDAEECRNMYVSSERNNNAPFLVRRLIGKEVEIIPRTSSDLLRVVVVDPTSGNTSESLHEHVQPNQPLRLQLPAPYGIVLLGALIEEKAWEGWCAVLHPSELQLSCESFPEKARPGSRVTITLKTNRSERVVPVQLIVKDQRLIASSDPQVELAASIKKNLDAWSKLSTTGDVEHQLADYEGIYRGAPMLAAMSMPVSAPAAPMMQAAPTGLSGPPTMSAGAAPRRMLSRANVRSPMAAQMEVREKGAVQTETAPTPTTTLTRMRVQFPEIIYNNIVHVQGEMQVEVQLGDSMTRYSIEAFALDRETLDWQRATTALEATQAVYGELTVSPFVREGDPVLGRLDLGAASGRATVEIRLNDTVLPLFDEAGQPLPANAVLTSGSVVRFPIRPGALTAIVHDAQSGEADVSERYVTEPGQLRHIMRRLRLLTPGDEVTLQSSPHLLELRPMPGLERPFQFFVEGAAKYPFGCIEQTSMKLVAMYTGYITNAENVEAARDYEAAIIAWHKRLKSMYLPQQGFCFYPPQDGGASKPDTHYAPRGVKHLLNLPDGKRSGIRNKALSDLLDDIQAMAKEAAAYYKIANPPTQIQDCHDAYKVMVSDASQNDKARAATFVRSRLKEHNGQTYVEVAQDQHSYRLWGAAVSTREETAYAAAALFAGKEPADLTQAIAATNYLTAQLNEEGRLYSTVDTAACLVLLIALRDAGVVVSGKMGRVVLNGQEISLAEALAYNGKVESLRCLEGVVAAQMTSEIFEDWDKFQSNLSVEVSLERKGRAQKRFKVGDDLELVIRVPNYEPGMIAHVCLPDALARVIGGGQVKRFSLDFCEQNVLRVPLAAIGATRLPNEESQNILTRWLKPGNNSNAQHWAVIVRNMFKEEQIGNPGLLAVSVE